MRRRISEVVYRVGEGAMSIVSRLAVESRHRESICRSRTNSPSSLDSRFRGNDDGKRGPLATRFLSLGFSSHSWFRPCDIAQSLRVFAVRISLPAPLAGRCKTRYSIKTGL